MKALGFKAWFMCVLLGVFPEFLVDPYCEPLVWFMIRVVPDIKMSVSESQSRKVELTCMHSKKRDDYCEYLHITTEPVFVSTKTSLMAMIFIS